MARLTPEEVARMNALLDEQKAQLGDINDMTSIQAERYKAIQNIQKQANKALEDGLTSTEQKMLDLLDVQEDLVDQARALSTEAEELQKLLDDHASTKAGSITLSEVDLQLALDRKEIIEAEMEVLAEINRQTEQRVKHEEKLEDLADGYLETFLGIRQQQEGFVGALQESVQNGNSLGGALADVGKGLLDNIASGISLNTVLFSIAGKIVESTIAMVFNTDDALANFNQMTTAGGELNGVLIEASLDTREMGIGMEETVQAAQELYENMSGFTGLTSEAKGEMLTLAAGMEKAGVSAANTGKLLDTAMKSFGMTTSEATDLSKELLATSQALSIPAGKLAQDFNTAMGELAKYGPKGVEVFKCLAAQAKLAGVEMNTLLSVAGQFDTIEGAANATSKLNAILGSNINTMEMLNATEEDRIALLQQAVNATGKSFDEMDRFEKQAIASAAGISDMNEAAKLFNAETAAFADAADSMDEVGASQADLARQAEAATSMQKQMSLMMEAMAVAVAPLLKIMRPLVQIMFGIVEAIAFVLTPVGWLLEAFVNLATGFADFIGISDGLGIALTALAIGGIAYVGSALIALSGPISIAGVSAATASPFFATLGASLMTVAWPALAVVAALAAVGLAIYLLYEYGEGLIDLFMDLGSAIMDAFSGSFDGLHDIFVQPFIDAWSAITDFFGFASPAKAAGDLGSGLVDGMVAGLSGLSEMIAAPFVAGFSMAGEAIMSILDFLAPVIDMFKSFFNIYLGGMNAVIGGLNSLSITVPDWVPLIGGKEFGFSLPMIPMLEEGGGIDKEGAAYLHKGETVLPAAETSLLDEATSTAMSFMSNPVEAVAGAVGLGTDEVVAALKENTAVMRSLAGSGTTGGGGNNTIVLELNERQLGKAVTTALNKKNQLSLG